MKNKQSVYKILHRFGDAVSVYDRKTGNEIKLEEVEADCVDAAIYFNKPFEGNDIEFYFGSVNNDTTLEESRRTYGCRTFLPYRRWMEIGKSLCGNFKNIIYNKRK